MKHSENPAKDKPSTTTTRNNNTSPVLPVHGQKQHNHAPSMHHRTTLRLSSPFFLLALACLTTGCEKKKPAPAFSRATTAVEIAGLNNAPDYYVQLMRDLETVQQNRLKSAEMLAGAARDLDRAEQEEKRLKKELDNFDKELKALKDAYKTAKTASGGASDFSILWEGQEMRKSGFAAYFANRTKVRENAAHLWEEAKKNSKKEENEYNTINGAHTNLEKVEKDLCTDIRNYLRDQKRGDRQKQIDEISKTSSSIATTIEENRKSNESHKLPDAAAASLSKKDVSSNEIDAATAALDAE